ncbi:glycosyltransferase family 4 protein [Candidatus Peregrinibacteria bacterium]|jgi:glycosyltransferase involved in cell wall biosynthesis|nr:glycosyltransferase family 4 protein [Candidatus Peregrinibacteria bacterium]MBT3598363.1 glycosyltransferase family 4 protein [Candidatus Peregrinibacteria bacterium]MBT4367351.1 glycosyltransferase family 4 protein [Candidatus Peregrinibacteria bacterium]MBT4585537.1 glycosyltransferase family 4 protein [Candidatus Peregrinibacteria bacterium]MBT6731352.1 glycosyltransferase family 4 protein [Candidatus Peregrinibacteria bacterium]
MHFAIDIREACRSKRTGKGQWVYGFVDELLSRDVDITLLSNTPPPEHFLSRAKNVVLFPSGISWHFRAAHYIRRNRDINMYISPTSFLVPGLLPQNIHSTCVIHDLIAFRGDPHQLKATLIERLTLRHCLRSSRIVLAVSQSTKNDLLSRYPFLSKESVVVIYAGPFKSSAPLNQPDGKTILCPATLSPRKNQKNLILAYRLLPNDLKEKYKLLLIGASGWHDQDIIDLINETDGVSWLDFVPNDDYERLLNTCDVLALPSLYEGFGMQILDALQRGIPVLTSNRGSLYEVTDKCAVHVHPEIVEDILRGLVDILTKDKIRKKLREDGPEQASNFSWKRTVDEFIKSTDKIPW